MAGRRLLLVHLFLPDTLSFRPWSDEPGVSHFRVPSQAKGNGDVGNSSKTDAPPSPQPDDSLDYSNLSYEDLNIRLKRASLSSARRDDNSVNLHEEAISDTEDDQPIDGAIASGPRTSHPDSKRASFSEHVKKVSQTSLLSERTAARSHGGQGSLHGATTGGGSRRGSATLNRPILQPPADIDIPLAPASDHGRSANAVSASPIQMTSLDVSESVTKPHTSSRRGSMSGSAHAGLSAPATLQTEKNQIDLGGTRTPGAHAGGKAGMMTPLSIIGDLKAKRAALPSQQLSTPGDTDRHHPFGSGAVTPMREPTIPSSGARTPGLRPPMSSNPFSRATVSGLTLTKVNENPTAERALKTESKTPNKAVPSRPGLGNFSRSTEGRVPQTPIDHGRGAEPGPSKSARPGLTPRPSSSNVINRLFRESDNESHTPFAEPSPAKLPSGEPSSASAAGQIAASARARSGSKPRSNARQGPAGRRTSSISGRPVNRRASTDIGGNEDDESTPQSPILPPYDFQPNPSCNGGLINAVRSLDEDSLRGGKLFIGTPSLSIDEWAGVRERAHITSRMREERDCLPVWLDDYVFEQAYAHFCKQILWPTFHYELPTRKGLEHEHEGFECYRQLNETFAKAIVQEYREGDIIFVNDYHLVLVPAMVREKLPHAKICFFLHVAWPSSEIFRCLTARTFILKGMLGADLVGFQTANFARHFRQTVSRILQLEATPKGIQIDGRGGFVTVGVFPIGIDVAVLNKRRAQPDVADWVQKLQARYEGKKIIVGRDKLDSIKGVRQKLLAFETLLHEHTDLIGEIVLLQVALATTEENEEIAAATDVVARINNRYSTLTYQPVVFLHVQDITFCQYLALLTVADAFLATSLREGMNLTTHEFVICQEVRHKPLILSEFTGTYSSLRACIGINPWNTKQVADAIYRAIKMNPKEGHERWKDLHRQVTSQDAQHWIKSLLGRLERAHIDQQRRNNLFVPRLEIGQSEWRASKSRLIFFDLEGTLMRDDPVSVYEHGFEPPEEVVKLLVQLTDDAKNRVYVVSGKGARDLDKLAAKVPRLGLVAENGCSVMYAGAATHNFASSSNGPQTEGKVHKAWTSLVAGTNMSWRDSVLEILSYFTERTPGSWLEDRGASILWRFWSKADEVDASEDKDYQWARRQAAEVQNLIYDSLGERFSLRIIPAKSSFLILPKNTSRASAAQHIISFSHVGAQYGLHPAASNSDRQGPTLTSTINFIDKQDVPTTPPSCTRSMPATPSIEHSMDSFRQPSNAWAPSMRSPEQPFGPNSGHDRKARYNAYALHPSGLGAFDLVLCIGQDDGLFSYINSLDLAFAPITCTSAGSSPDSSVRSVDIGSEANYYLDGPEDVLDSVRDILDFRGRDQRWGVPAMVDV